jgi:hypothetical protein
MIERTLHCACCSHDRKDALFSGRKAGPFAALMIERTVILDFKVLKRPNATAHFGLVKQNRNKRILTRTNNGFPRLVSIK